MSKGISTVSVFFHFYYQAAYGAMFKNNFYVLCVMYNKLHMSVTKCVIDNYYV